MFRVDRGLVDRYLEDTPAAEAITEINQWLVPRDRSMPDLGWTRPEWNLRLFCIYTGEVGNGGHAQFFLNPGGLHAERTVTALSEMALEESAAGLRQACSVFGSQFPSSQDERESAIGNLAPKALKTWRRLDHALWNRSGVDAERVLRYLKIQRNQLL